MRTTIPNHSQNSANRQSFIEKVIQRMKHNRIANTTDIDNDEIIEIEEEGLWKPIEWLLLWDIWDSVGLERSYLEICHYFFFYLKQEQPIRTIFKVIDTTIFYAIIYPKWKLKENYEKQVKEQE